MKHGSAARFQKLMRLFDLYLSFKKDPLVSAKSFIQYSDVNLTTLFK